MSNMQNSWVLQGKGIHTLTYTTWVFSYRSMVPDFAKPAETYEEPTALNTCLNISTDMDRIIGNFDFAQSYMKIPN